METLTESGKHGCQERPSDTPVLGANNSRLEVHVIFTTPQATRVALRLADSILRGSRCRIHFLVPQVVPLAFPLTRPPVSIAFTERLALAIAFECRGAAAIQIEVVLCGNRDQGVERVLGPNSLVIIGSKYRRWRSAEQKLARRLRVSGHRVIHVLAD